jgi:hypothetical protein
MILDEIDSIHDNFIGTNKINYKHIFYVALYKNNEDNSIIYSKNEIDQIKWCNWHESLKLFRPYHENKINIINKIFLFMINMCENNNQTLVI